MADPIAAWRDSIASYLGREGLNVRLTTLGTVIPRPAGVSHNRSLTAVLSGDSRFVLSTNPPNITVSLRAASAQNVPSRNASNANPNRSADIWLDQVISFLRMLNRHVYLKHLGQIIPRPDGFGTKMQRLLRTDRHQRFQLHRVSGGLTVGLIDCSSNLIASLAELHAGIETSQGSIEITASCPNA
jgi:hypothetical protein